MQNITDVNTFTSPVTVLSDGDPVVAAESIPTAQALANRTLFNSSGLRLTSTVSAAGTTVLTATSTRGQVLTGSTTQTFQLPDETTLNAGAVFEFFNLSTGILTIKDSAGTTLGTITVANGYASLLSTSSGGATGGWVFQKSPPGQALGTATNDSAAAGEVGEYLTASGSLVNLPALTGTNIASISLTAGEWDVWFHGQFQNGATGTLSSIRLLETSISTSTGNIVTSDPMTTSETNIPSGTAIDPGNSSVFSAPPVYLRAQLSSTVIHYGVMEANFSGSGGTMAGSGRIRARRVR